jgi:hypothetical protein
MPRHAHRTLIVNTPFIFGALPFASVTGCTTIDKPPTANPLDQTEPERTTPSPTPTPTPTPTEPSQPPLPDRVSLGNDLFQPGSEKLKANGEDDLLRRIAAIPREVAVDLKVFNDSVVERIRGRQRTSQLNLARGHAVRAVLERHGYTIRHVIDRGTQSIDGKPPTRRVDALPVTPDVRIPEGASDLPKPLAPPPRTGLSSRFPNQTE